MINKVHLRWIWTNRFITIYYWIGSDSNPSPNPEFSPDIAHLSTSSFVVKAANASCSRNSEVENWENIGESLSEFLEHEELPALTIKEGVEKFAAFTTTEEEDASQINKVASGEWILWWSSFIMINH